MASEVQMFRQDSAHCFGAESSPTHGEIKIVQLMYSMLQHESRYSLVGEIQNSAIDNNICLKTRNHLRTTGTLCKLHKFRRILQTEAIRVKIPPTIFEQNRVPYNIAESSKTPFHTTLGNLISGDREDELLEVPHRSTTRNPQIVRVGPNVHMKASLNEGLNA